MSESKHVSEISLNVPTEAQLLRRYDGDRPVEPVNQGALMRILLDVAKNRMRFRHRTNRIQRSLSDASLS